MEAEQTPKQHNFILQVKNFFEKLFGRKSPGDIGNNHAQAAALNSATATSEIGELKPGDFIAGEYRIRRVFGGEGGAGGKGKSGMGVVYLVEARTSEEPFVLKTFQSKLANAASIARFKAEAETWINIGKHANIVQCHWVNEFSGQLFVAAEFVWPDSAGRNTLTQYIAAGNLSLRQQLHWIAHFCFGMKHAMAHGLRAHRDVKPDNLMIDTRGRLKITDFGLAKGLSLSEQSDSLNTNRDRDENLTASGTAFGTPPFMSPEQFLDSSAVNHRADIYSLGVVIYMMISGGKLPIVPVGNSGWASAHRTQRVARLDHPLMSFAEKCLEKDPRQRFQSYDEILAVVGQACRKNNFPVPQDEQTARAEFERQWGIAMSLVNLDRPEEAIPKLRQMESQWPESPEVYNELSRAFQRLGKTEEALTATQKALELDQYSTADWNNLGGILANLGRLAEAKSAYGKSLQIDAQNTGAMMGLVQLLIHEGELKDAKTWCELALFWRPEKPLVLQVASDCFFKCGEPAKAIQLLDKLLATNPDDAVAWLKKGSAINALGKQDAAIACYDKAIETAPRTQNVWKFRGGSAKGMIGAVPANMVEVEAWNGKGLVFRALGQNLEALACYDRALKIDQQKADVWCNKGNAFFAENRHAEALQCFDKAVALDPRDMKSWCNRGVALKALGRLGEAADSYEKALQIDPRDVKTWFNKGNALAAQERYQDALVCFQEAQKLGHPDANRSAEQCQRMLQTDGNDFEQGCASYRAGKFEEAIRCYDAALAGDPGNPDIWNNKGAAMLRLNRDAEALVSFDHAISLAPENAKVWNSKGQVLLRLGQLGDALPAFHRAVKLDPDYANAWFGQGEALAKSEKHQEAVACFENVVRLSPKDEQAWYYMAYSMGFLGRHGDVIKCCDRALEINPRSSRVWILKGLGFSSMERFHEALQCFQEAEKLGDASAVGHIANCRSSHADWYFRLGSRYQQEGNHAEAISCYEKGLAMNPRKTVIWVNKGAALLALQRASEAAVCFDRAIALDPDDSGAWNNKGIALMSLGQREEGAACLLKAIRMRGGRPEQ